MTILKNFDFEELRRKRAREAASSGVNLEESLNQISPEIAKLKVGETAQLEIPGANENERKGNLRKFVMSITAKLNNLTPKGGAWEGRDYAVMSDGERYVYVQRGEDKKGKDIPVRRRAGGRRAGGSTGEGETTSTADSGAVVTEHA